MSQKGFVPLISLTGILIVVVAILGGYLAGSRTNGNKKIDLTNRKFEVSASPSLDKFGLKKIDSGSLIASKNAENKAGSEEQNKQTSPSPSSSSMFNQYISAAGGYSFSGSRINYNFKFPRNGGEVSGSVEGICKGPVVGNFDGGEGGKIKGKVSISCGVGIFSQDLTADYEGKVYLKDGRADINWVGETPFYSDTGSFSLYF